MNQDSSVSDAEFCEAGEEYLVVHGVERRRQVDGE